MRTRGLIWSGPRNSCEGENRTSQPHDLGGIGAVGAVGEHELDFFVRVQGLGSALDIGGADEDVRAVCKSDETEALRAR